MVGVGLVEEEGLVEEVGLVEEEGLEVGVVVKVLEGVQKRPLQYPSARCHCTGLT